MATDWMVVQTASNSERATAARLMQFLALVPFLPLIEVRTNVRGRLHARPLFPGYLFVPVIVAWASLLRVDGIVRVLLSGEEPARLSDSIINEIRSRLGPDSVLRMPKSRFKRGQRLRMRGGPMAGLLCRFERMSGSERCQVLMELLGRQVAAQVEVAQLDEAAL